MSVILPFEKNVPLQSFSHYFIYLGILEGNRYDEKFFLFNHFVTLNYCHIDGFISFFEEKKLYKLFNRDKFFYDVFDPISFVRGNIDSGKYILIDLNHKDIGASDCTWNFIHEIFIYGYDKEKRTFNAYGFVIDKKINGLVLRAFELPFSELEKSYHDSAEYARNKRIHKNYSISIKRAPETRLNIRKIKFDVFLYLRHLIPRLVVYSPNQGAYKAYRKNIEKAFNKSVPKEFDLRFIKTLQGRAKILKIFEQYIGISEELQTKCTQMEDILFSALLYGGLFNKKENREKSYAEKFINSMIDTVYKSKQMEYEIIKDIYEKLKEM